MAKQRSKLAGITAALAAAAAVGSGAAAPVAGQASEITLTLDRIERGAGANGSSHDQDTVTQRVTAVRKDGVELRYDLPSNASAAERASTWQFPLRVFKPEHGPAQLLDRGQMAARIARWLAAAKLPRSACGHWVFTWNAFRIDCDPETALESLAAFDVGTPDLRAGASYRENGALGTAPLVRTDSAAGATFSTRLDLDPAPVRKERAEADVAAGEVMRKPVTLDAALRARAADAISGTVQVTFDVDGAGAIRRRTRLLQVDTRTPDGRSSTETINEVLERRPIPAR